MYEERCKIVHGSDLPVGGELAWEYEVQEPSVLMGRPGAEYGEWRWEYLVQADAESEVRYSSILGEARWICARALFCMLALSRTYQKKDLLEMIDRAVSDQSQSLLPKLQREIADLAQYTAWWKGPPEAGRPSDGLE